MEFISYLKSNKTDNPILASRSPTETIITISNLHTPKQIQIIWLTTTDNISDALPPEQENLVAAIWSSIDRFTEN